MKTEWTKVLDDQTTILRPTGIELEDKMQLLEKEIIRALARVSLAWARIPPYDDFLFDDYLKAKNELLTFARHLFEGDKPIEKDDNFYGSC